MEKCTPCFVQFFFHKNKPSKKMLASVLFLLCVALQQACAFNIFFPSFSYTGVVWRGAEVMVFNTSEGYEMRVAYVRNTSVQYCETERNETSDQATLSFFVRQSGNVLYETSLSGATQIVSGRRNLSETYIPYLLECTQGKVNFLGAVPIPIIAGVPSPALSPQIEDCVNRTLFTRRNVPTELNCTAPTQAPSFTFQPTTAALPGRDSGAEAFQTHFVVVALIIVSCLHLF